MLGFFSDASFNKKLGFGATFKSRWIVGQWNESFIMNCKPSIEFLELFALTVAVLTWSREPELNNSRITVHCDNQAVVQMVNKTTSSCLQCMKLLRMLALNGINCNRRLFATYIASGANILADALSRLNSI